MSCCCKRYYEKWRHVLHGTNGPGAHAHFVTGAVGCNLWFIWRVEVPKAEAEDTNLMSFAFGLDCEVKAINHNLLGRSAKQLVLIPSRCLIRAVVQ